jgi:phenylalanyl-tRNA synthetase beta chain
MAVMRSTLWGGLLDVLDGNLKRGQTQVRILELGRCYVFNGDGFEEPHRIAGLVCGPVWPEQWGQAARAADFFDIKACVEALFWPCECRVVSAQHPALHPGQSGQIMVNDRPVGWIGVLHPALVQRRQWSSAPVLFELELDEVLQRRVPMNQPLSRFQAVRRDLAVVVDAAVPAQSLLDTMRAAKVSYVTDIVLFDNYRGKHIDSDKKSLAFGVVMQDNHKTLTDNDADATLAQLADLLQQRFGAQLRS